VLGVLNEIIFVSAIEKVDDSEFYIQHQKDLENAGWKLVEPKWIPEEGDTYFHPEITIRELYIDEEWDGLNIDQHRLKHNLVFKTKEEAIARAKDILYLLAFIALLKFIF